MKKRTCFILIILLATPLSSLYIYFEWGNISRVKSSWVDHTSQVLLEAEKLERIILELTLAYGINTIRIESESISLPHMVTHNELSTLRDSLHESYDNILILTGENPEQQDRLKSIEKEVSFLLNFPLDLSRTKHVHDLQSLKIKFDKIEHELAVIRANELDHLSLRTKNYEALRYQQALFLIASLLIYIVAILLLAYCIHFKLLLPIRQLTEITKSYSQGKDETLELDSHSEEITSLATCIEALRFTSKMREDALRMQANYDPLTGLRNRNFILEDIRNALDEALTNYSKVVLIYVDLNKLKFINDTFGHHVGDAAIQEASLRLSANIRGSDTVYRVGGDEFIVLFRNINKVSDLNSVISTLQKAFKTPTRIENSLINLSLSMGSSVGPDDSCVPKDLITCADRAMYFAKKNGLQSCQSFSSLFAKT